MQLEMIRAPRTTKNTTSQKTPVTTISTLSTTRKENDPPEQVRFDLPYTSTVE
jgi:hypothetical protein